MKQQIKMGAIACLETLVKENSTRRHLQKGCPASQMLAALPEKARKLPKDRPPAGWQGIDKPPAYARIISRIHWKGAASWQKSNAEKKDYDLLDVVMVCLGQKKYNELTGLLSMLNLVLKDNYLSSADKREKLAKEFHVEITPELEKGVAEMCNLSAGIERQGIKKGIRKGIKKGIEKGRAEGENRLAKLISHLLSIGKNDEIKAATESEQLRNELYKKYGIA